MIEDEIRISRISDDKIKATWCVSPIKKNFVNEYFGNPFSSFRKAIRLYDVSNLVFNGNNAHHHYEFIIRDELQTWTIKNLQADRSYCLEFGIKLSATEFFPLLRSAGIYMGGNTDEQNVELSSGFTTDQHTQPGWCQQVSTYTYYGSKTKWGERK
jgi:uncharacterized protein